jgi:WD40 repeat protein/serine/threonine protein kinase
MLQTFTCPQNHRWQGTGAMQHERCPMCGAAPALIAPAEDSKTGRAERPSLAPGGPPEQPPTVMASGARPVEEKENQERTLAPELPAGSLAIGRTVNAAFEILGELGRGGMGVVYKAKQLRLNRLVALKMILSGSHAGPDQLARFRAEAETLAPLQHPNIVQVYEVGELDGHPYFSLEFIDGGSLADRLGGAPQPPRQAAQIVESLARAIHFAHLRGIVHRDLKPANVLLAVTNVPQAVTGAGKDRSATVLLAEPAPLTAFTPKITDFGLAKNLESDSGQTKTGAILGTPSYISPEQASGKKEIGPATDVYALGAILYEMLTGRPPFRGESSMDTMLQVMTEEPVPPRRLQPKVPADLETICLKCLQKEPNKRYSSGEALADDLMRFLKGEPIQARPIGIVGRTIKWARRRPAVAALAALGVLAIFTILTISLYYNAELTQANKKEQQRAQELALQKKTVEDQRQLAVDAQQKAEAARKTAEQERKRAEDRLDESRRSIYSFQLAQVANLAERDPARGLELLDDKERCPDKLRDFTWAYLHRVCSRDRATLAGSKAPVAAVAIAPDGKTLASAGSDETVLLWDMEKHASRPIKTRHAGPIVALAFAPDGQTLATGGFDKTVRLHNVVTGAELALLEGHTEGVRAVAYSLDGQKLASGGHDRSIILWDLASRRPKATLRGHTGPVCALAFAPDGQTLASGAGDRTVRLWDVPAEKEIGPPLTGHADTVLSVTFAPTGRLLASGGADRAIKLWHPADRKPLETLQGHLDAVNAVAFAPDGKVLASASADRTVRLWQAITGEERTILKGHGKAVLALAFTRDGQTLASGSADHTVKLWDARPRNDPTPYRIDPGDRARPPVTTWARDGKTLAIVNQPDKLLRLVNLVEQKEQIFLQGFSVKFDALALTPDGNLLAGATDDLVIRLYGMEKGQSRGMAKGHTGRILSLAFAPDSKLLVSGGADSMVRFWDETGKDIGALPVQQGPVGGVLFSPDGKLLATCDAKGVKVWDVKARKLIADLGPPSAGAKCVAFSPDSQTLAIAGGVVGTVYFWDTVRKQERGSLRGHAGTVRCLTFSPDGNTLATGHADWNVVLWDSTTGQERATLTGQTQPIHAVSFSADGQTLISLGTDGAVRRWQAK